VPPHQFISIPWKESYAMSRNPIPGQRVSVPPGGRLPRASVGTVNDRHGARAVVDLDDYPGEPLHIDADVLTVIPAARYHALANIGGEPPEIEVWATYNHPGGAVADQIRRWEQRENEAETLTRQLTLGAGVVSFGRGGTDGGVLVNPERDAREQTLKTAAAHLFNTEFPTVGEIDQVRHAVADAPDAERGPSPEVAGERALGRRRSQWRGGW
jgi:hypothetical protein